MLPPAANARFYDRDNIIGLMDKHLRGDRAQSGLRMYGLYGLGGVGKSHVALKYAQTKMEHFQFVLWIHGTNKQSLEQSFTEIAFRLQIKGADRGRHEQNRIEVLNWLHQTSGNWLLIYDNIEDLETFWKFAPATSHGCAIVTTRHQIFADQIAEARSEVLHFDTESGSRFLLYLLSEEVAEDIEDRQSASAIELSERLNGHALAIHSVAGIIRLRSWTIEEFLVQHSRNPKRAESRVKTVWQLSFASLGDQSSKILGVLAYVMPDNIPDELFMSTKTNDLPPRLEFCVDDWE
ncbi:MAG: hypothetical protein L6R38_009438 [Xanthoria sp. 2 TBL-2021]|nr:MAG: hypothetical protein L6R38_009438 [Xanthoria sp. 2 TBL-2021]